MNLWSDCSSVPQDQQGPRQTEMLHVSQQCRRLNEARMYTPQVSHAGTRRPAKPEAAAAPLRPKVTPAMCTSAIGSTSMLNVAIEHWDRCFLEQQVALHDARLSMCDD